jgi:hypothetical protein
VPTTVSEAFAASDLDCVDVVRWRTRLPISRPGVYVVSLAESPDTYEGRLVGAPLAAGSFRNWLDECPRLTLDGSRPTVPQLCDRIRRFWVPDEVILYIGKATSLSDRVGAFYRTQIGERKPHSGGYFLKLLSNLDKLWLHYGTCSSPADAEHAEDHMLRRFCTNVSDDSRRSLHDPGHPFPFANLEWPPRVRKAHGLRWTRKP